MQKKGFTLLIIILILCFLAVPSWAGDLLPEGLVIEDTYRHGLGQPVGKILLVRGEVVIVHKGESVGYRVRKGLPVYKMDTLISLVQSRSIVEMNDRSRLSLTSRTRITVNRSIYKKGRRERSSFFNMAVGRARFWVTKMAAPRRSEFRVKTATAVLGVRGSDFVVDARPETTVVTTLNNTEVEVISIAMPEEPVILHDFQQTTIDKDAPPSAVIDISSDAADDLMDELPVKIGEELLPGEGIDQSGTGKEKESRAVMTGDAQTAGTKTQDTSVGVVAGQTEAGATGAGPSTAEKPVAPSQVAAGPEIFVADGDLIEPEAIGEDVAEPAPLDLEIEDWRKIEDFFLETQDDINQATSEEAVAGELPGFPTLP